MDHSKKIVCLEQLDKTTPIEFFKIQDLGDFFNFKGHFQYNFYQIFWFTHVQDQSHEIDFTSYKLGANQLWITYPGQVHYLDSTGMQGYCITVDKDCFHRVLHLEAKWQSFTKNTHLQLGLTPDKIDLFTHIMDLISLEYQGKKRFHVLEKYLQLLIIHLQDLPVLNMVDIRIDSRLHTLLDLIERYFLTQRNACFYADKVGLSPKRMNQILIKGIGVSLKAQLQERLLLEAKRLVGYSQDNIQSISHSLNFSEVSYFNRFFKKATGLTPLEFRAKVKKV
ncbi:helix-turn-helix domain-containing protein [Myroides sp. LJL119]